MACVIGYHWRALAILVAVLAAGPCLAEPLALSVPEAGLRAQIDTATGLVREVASPSPTPARLVGDSEIYILQGDEAIAYDRVLTHREEQGGHVFELAPRADFRAPFTVEVRYAVEQGALVETVTFTATQDLPDGCRLGLRHRFEPERWSTLIGATRHLKVAPPGQPMLFSYGQPGNDANRNRFESWQSTVHPMAVLEAEDRYLLAGDLCLDRFVTLSPNEAGSYFPSVQRNPTSVRAGETFTLAVYLRSFSRDRFMLRDVWRWYAQNVFSTNTLLSRYATYEPHPYRSLGHGTLGAFTYYLPAREGRLHPGAHVWWYGWHDWVNETYPVEGQWWVNVNDWIQMAPDLQKQAIQRVQSLGFKPYLYFRDMLNLHRVGTEIPVDWARLSGPGDFDRYGSSYVVELPEKVQRDTGFPDVPWGYYNLSHPEARSWYLGQVKAALEAYRPAGVAWDMGWTTKDPGVLAVQATVYQWIRDHHPRMRVIANEGMSPSSYYADAVLIENGIVSGKTAYDYEVTKAFNTTMITLERFNIFEQVVKHILTGSDTWLPDRGVADVRRLTDYLQSRHPRMTGNLEELKTAAHFRAGLRDIALGSSWGYLEECPGSAIIAPFAAEINGMTLMTRSFSVQLPHGTDWDAEAGWYASAWVDEGRLRAAVFNDADTARSTTLRIQWNGPWTPGQAQMTATNVNSLGETRRIPVKFRQEEGWLVFDIPSADPFSLWTLSANEDQR